VVVPPPLVVTPPRVVVVTPPIRPRIAIFNFLVNCRPGLVPVGIDNWAADNLASYFAPTHVVIDRGEVCWWMGRLGITMRDVLNNPSARHGLAQALNARFFIFGAIQQTASFEVTTHMIDAETGARSGGGRIHVQDHTEMKLRLAELVHQTTLKPDEAARLAREGSDNEKVLNESRRLLKAGQYTQAAAVARTGLKSSPNNVALKSLLAQAEQQAEKARLEEARKREAERQQALALAARQREAALLQQAQAARRRAEQEARTRDDAARRAQEARKEQAYTQMLNQARTALKQGNPQRAVGFFESALALKPNEAGNQELALAKARQKEAAQMRAVEQDRQRREAEAKKRQEELARARARVEEEQQRRQAEEQIRRKEQEDRDQAQYTRLVDQARGLLARQQREAALAVLQAARRVKNSDEVEQLIAQTQEAQLRAEAQKKSEQARIELDRKLAQEKALREKIESEARKKQQAYQAALEQAQKALVEKRYDQAIASYQVAGKLFRTDAVLAGLQQAKQARGAEIARAEEQKRLQADLEKKRAMEERKKKEEEKQRGDFGRRMAEGRQALQAKRYQEAARIFGEALKLQPADAEAKQALQLALQGARTPPPPPPQRQPSPEYTRLMSQGQEFLAAKRYDEAIKAFSEALKIVPNDTAATKGLREAKQAVRTPPSVPPPAKPPAEYTSLIQAAAAAEKQQKYAEAVQAYRQALRIRPGDARASQGADFAQHMSDGQKLLAARKFSEAAREFQAALKLSPGNPTAKTLLQRARERRP
jgi:tetratricopeptide (TPR) repeat protein